MAYLATDKNRSRFGLQLEQRQPLTAAMRSAIGAVLESGYVELVTSEFDFGLDRPVSFAAFSDDAAIQADVLPAYIVAARVNGRDVVVHVHDTGHKAAYVATIGASFQQSQALNRYLSYSFARLNWVDAACAEVPRGALRTLYCDDGIDCIAGVDINGSELLIYANRGYTDRGSKPRSLNDLIDAHTAGGMQALAQEVFQTRMSAIAASLALPQPELMGV
jgi:hypothetical protein